MLSNLHLVSGIAGIWFLVNGLLHDIFVIIRHKGGYNRELLRLLMDGHVLILSGVILLVTMPLLKDGNTTGSVIALVVASGMAVYCAMIFPFLRSVVTFMISIFMIVIFLIKILS